MADLNMALLWKLLMLPSSMLEDRDMRVRLEWFESSRSLTTYVAKARNWSKIWYYRRIIRDSQRYIVRRLRYQELLTPCLRIDVSIK